MRTKILQPRLTVETDVRYLGVTLDPPPPKKVVFKPRVQSVLKIVQREEIKLVMSCYKFMLRFNIGVALMLYRILLRSTLTYAAYNPELYPKPATRPK
jgi:hypothetical protein